MLKKLKMNKFLNNHFGPLNLGIFLATFTESPKSISSFFALRPPKFSSSSSSSESSYLF